MASGDYTTSKVRVLNTSTNSKSEAVNLLRPGEQIGQNIYMWHQTNYRSSTLVCLCPLYVCFNIALDNKCTINKTYHFQEGCTILSSNHVKSIYHTHQASSTF